MAETWEAQRRQDATIGGGPPDEVAEGGSKRSLDALFWCLLTGVVMHDRPFLPVTGIAAVALIGLSILGFRLGGAPRAHDRHARAALPVPTATQRLATFAGGCFWSMQKAF